MNCLDLRRVDLNATSMNYKSQQLTGWHPKHIWQDLTSSCKDAYNQRTSLNEPVIRNIVGLDYDVIFVHLDNLMNRIVKYSRHTLI